MRRLKFTTGEYYHIFNRGVDKRTIFSEKKDLERFFHSMQAFNTIEPIGSIYENSFKDKSKQLGRETSKLNDRLVSFVAYCLNPNHYHFILEPLIENGVEKFMHRLGLGYTMYFNEKYKRSGSLFQGRYKAAHINSNEYLLYLSVYVNLNTEAHQLGDSVSKLVSKSSWSEYVDKRDNNNFCKKDIILDQFNKVIEYKKFAFEALDIIKENKEISKLLLE